MSEDSSDVSSRAMGRYWTDIISDWEASSYGKGKSRRAIERFAGRFRKHIQDRAESALKILQPVLSEASVVEIGCGSGDLVFEMLSRGASRVTGVDVAQGAIELALQRAECLGFTRPEVTFECALVRSNVNISMPVDVLVGLGITEYVHADDLGKFMSQIKPTYFLLSFDERTLTLQKIMHMGYRTFKKLPFYHRYRAREFQEIMESFGFDGVRIVHDRSNAFATNIPQT
jgi:2-polyprenyl-3-methyl-5-hydroxy-6-metoxy-1,4-benzoquinol methylase